MYKVFIEKQVRKQLKKIPEPDYSKIKTAILNFSQNPRPYGYKKLKARLGHRVRVGNYRIIYEINDNLRSVYVFDVGHRKDIYRNI